MSEIVNDLKVELLEISESKGLNLTAESSRIKHTKNGQLDIMSNGPINISGGNGSNFDGLSVVINGGNGLENSNSSGGSIVIAGGHGTGNAESGQINITAGSNFGGTGGDIYLEAGLSQYEYDSYLGNPGGNIYISTGLGGEKCGDVNIRLGPDVLAINNIGKSGRFNIRYGAFKLAVFDNNTERNNRIPTPEKGDMCFVDNKITVYNGTVWKTIAFE